MVAMAATVTLRGGASIFYSSIVSSMGIIRVPLYSVLLCFKNDCPSTCRPTQSMTRTHKEDIRMCCVYEYVHVHVRKNKYLRTPICVHKYTNAWDVITFHCVRSTCELSLSDLPFRSTCALLLPHLPVLSASRFISLNIYDCHTFTYLLLITPPLSGDEFTGSKFLVSTAPPFFQLVALWYDSLYFSLLLA